MDSANFKSLIDGKEVALFTLQNVNGMICQITNYGCCIVSLHVPDRKGIFKNVVLGYDSLSTYLDDQSTYLGAAVGRYANRIANGQFNIDGTTYNLDKNNGHHHIHGGLKGFNRQVWEVIDTGKNFIKMSLFSPHLEEGYPGNLAVTVSYFLTDENALEIAYSAETDLTTHVNLTNHTYFNLSGNEGESILDHVLQINADSFLPIDASSIPTGESQNVIGTPFDFTSPQLIRDQMELTNQQLISGNGFDHNFILNGKNYQLAARVWEKTTGILLEVLTDEPGLQFYTGNSLTKPVNAKMKQGFQPRSGLCLETQHFPNSPNNPEFPSTLLSPGEVYNSRCTYRFSQVD